MSECALTDDEHEGERGVGSVFHQSGGRYIYSYS